jgi:transposase
MVEFKQVRTFVGIDAHGEHCNLKALSRQGRGILELEVPTNSAELCAAVKPLPGPVWAMVESSSIAPFVVWSLEAVLDRVIVCETRENRWIAKSEDKSDPADADRLARLLRMGEFKEVYVPSRERQELRELVLLYDKMVGDTARAKSRLKAKFRQHGLAVSGSAGYSEAGRQSWLDRVRRRTVRFMLEALYAKLDAAEEVQEILARRLSAMLGSRREYRRLKTMPGIGEVVAAIFVGVIDNPHRFPDKRKLWKYAGLSVRGPWTGDPKQAKTGGSCTGNRLLKYAAMVAAERATVGSNRFGRRYQEMLARGLDRSMALKTTARNILATALAMWKSGTDYREPESA